MAFTTERLSRAQSLFQNSSSVWLQRILDGSYDWSSQATSSAHTRTSRPDDDGVEDYDSPAQENNKRKRSIQAKPPNPSPSKKAKSALPRLTRLRDTEVDHISIYSSSDEGEPDTWDQYWAVNPETNTLDSPYRLRIRNKDEMPKLDPFTQADEPTSSNTTSPSSEHGTSKGCIACYELAMDCSLATDPDPLAYPCTTCALDELECVVIPEPQWKQTCESCKQTPGVTCSYLYASYDHSQPCRSCINQGFVCVAGPADFNYLLSESEVSTGSQSSTPPCSCILGWPCNCSGSSFAEHLEWDAETGYIHYRDPADIPAESIEFVEISDSESEHEAGVPPIKSEPMESIEESDWDSANGDIEIIEISDDE